MIKRMGFGVRKTRVIVLVLPPNWARYLTSLSCSTVIAITANTYQALPKLVVPQLSAYLNQQMPGPLPCTVI